MVEDKRIAEYEFINYYRDSFNNVLDIYKNHNKTYENTSLNKLINLQKISLKYDKFNMIKNYNLSFFQSVIICLIVLLYFSSMYQFISIGSLFALINLVSLLLSPLLSMSSTITSFSNFKLIQNRLKQLK